MCVTRTRGRLCSGFSGGTQSKGKFKSTGDMARMPACRGHRAHDTTAVTERQGGEDRPREMESDTHKEGWKDSDRQEVGQTPREGQSPALK